MNIKNMAGFTLILALLGSCSGDAVIAEDNPSLPSEMEPYEPAPEFLVLAYVDREDIQKHGVRVIHQSIKHSPDSETGINFTYYFDEDGRLEASSPGFSPTTYYNFFDAQGRLEYTGWAEKYGAPIGEKRPVENGGIMPWETSKDRSIQKVDLFNTCDGVNAQYLYHPTPSGSDDLPSGGRFEYLRERQIEDVPDDFLPGSPEELIAEFRYEFYKD